MSSSLPSETATPAPSDAPTPGTPSPWLVFRMYLMLGLQSFGGGPALLFLMRRMLVEQRGWLSDEEFVRAYAICQLTPGINLLGLTILVGWRLAGIVGALLALLGLLLPSVTLTIVLTAIYASVRQSALVQSALRGIIPATAGLTLLVAISLVRPTLLTNGRIDLPRLLLGSVLVLGSSVLVGALHVSVIIVLALAGVIGALARWRQ